MAPRRLDRWIWLLGGWLAAALAAWISPLEDLQHHWTDLQLRWLAPAGDARSVLVVDIDEATLRELAARGQPWPFARQVHAAATERLFALGARAVVFNLLFAEPRAGDDALAALAAEPGRPVVLAADVSNEFRTPIDAAMRARLRRFAAAGAADAAAASDWEGLVLPTPALLERARHIGVQRTALDPDGRLRCLHGWHRVDGELLPALVTAALLASGRPPPPPRCVTPLLRSHAGALRIVSLLELLDSGNPAALAAAVNGRTVFVGSPAVLDGQAMTPVGQIGGAAWQALAFEAIAAGELLAPRRTALDALVVGIAALPLLLALSGRRQPAGRRDALLCAAGLVLLLTVTAALLLAQAQPVALPLALLVWLAGAATLAARWMHQQEQAQQQAELASASARAGERAMSQFLSHMSHEIRTPLNAMLGVAQLLGETPLSPLQRRYVETLGHAGTHLSRLVDDVLDLSRWEAGGVALHREPFALRGLVDELRGLFEPLARGKSLHFAAAVDDACPPLVLGDVHRVRQVLMNLLGNAVKFTASGSVSIEVLAAAGGQGIEFVVRDSGIGIPADRLGAVFDPFTQADPAVGRRFGGSGLGLTICRRLVVAMGGEIQLANGADGGTTARVLLPLPAVAAEHGAAPPGASQPTLGGRRLLLAEDNEVNVMVVQGMLADTGVLLDVARDGREAVSMALAQRYDLILMDLLMPQLDGHEATRAIRAGEWERGQEPVPVIALSANTQSGDVQASLAAGCHAHLGKPVDKGTLIAAITQALAERARPLQAASANS